MAKKSSAVPSPEPWNCLWLSTAHCGFLPVCLLHCPENSGITLEGGLEIVWNSCTWHSFPFLHKHQKILGWIGNMTAPYFLELVLPRVLLLKVLVKWQIHHKVPNVMVSSLPTVVDIITGFACSTLCGTGGPAQCSVMTWMDGREVQEKGDICIIQPIHIVQEKLTQDCKAVIPQKKTLCGICFKKKHA